LVQVDQQLVAGGVVGGAAAGGLVKVGFGHQDRGIGAGGVAGALAAMGGCAHETAPCRSQSPDSSKARIQVSSRWVAESRCAASSAISSASVVVDRIDAWYCIFVQ
jgi:hypothetical protein